jgi:hypothetical protein
VDDWEKLGWEIAQEAEVSLTGLLTHPGDWGWKEDVTWAGMTCLIYLLNYGHQDPVGQAVRMEFERLKDFWDPEPEWN